MHSRFGSQTGARAGLVEGGDKSLVPEEVSVAPVACVRLESFGDLERSENLVALKVLEREDVAP